MEPRQIIKEKARNDSEALIGELLLNIGLNFIDSSIEIKINNIVICEIDFIFSVELSNSEKFVYIFETTTQKDDHQPKARSFHSKVSSSRVNQWLNDKYDIGHYKRKYIYMATNLKSKKLLESQTQDLSNQMSFFDGADIDWIKELYEVIGSWTKNEFLVMTGIKELNSAQKKDCEKYVMGNVEAFVYVDYVKDVLEYSYVARRREGNNDKAYQRMVSKSRVRTIGKDLSNGKIIGFPNAVIINSTVDLGVNKSNNEGSYPSRKNVLISGRSSCRIIDGQHRLAGYANAEPSVLDDACVPVILLNNVKLEEEAKLFLQVNRNQSKVDRNLMYLLKADWNWPPGDEEYFDKIVVQIAERMNIKGPLAGRIYLGTAQSIRKNKISLTSFRTALRKNNLIGKKGILQASYSDIENPQKELTSVMLEIIEKGDLDATKYLLSNRGFQIICRLVQIYERNLKAKNVKFKKKEFFEIVTTHVGTQPLLNELKDLQGAAGVRVACEKIVDAITQTSKEYRSLNTELKSLPKLEENKK